MEVIAASFGTPVAREVSQNQRALVIALSLNDRVGLVYPVAVLMPAKENWRASCEVKTAESRTKLIVAPVRHPATKSTGLVRKHRARKKHRASKKHRGAPVWEAPL